MHSARFPYSLIDGGSRVFSIIINCLGRTKFLFKITKKLVTIFWLARLYK
jgi:hypothetical protein